MLRSKPLFASMLTAGLLVMAFACSGSSSTSTTPQLNELSDVPSLNASDYDYTLNAEAVGGLTLTRGMRSYSDRPGQVGGFSRAACEGYTIKKQLFQDGQEVESFVCFIKALESANLGMTVGPDAWNYYEIHFPQPPGGGDDGPPPVV
ncbi:MAG: hypothetical protein V1798_10520, partial [Pseudomonadota bacterium]